jgi:hypothetical protein
MVEKIINLCIKDRSECLYIASLSLTELPLIPQNIDDLDCHDNKIKVINTLPSKIKYLWCQQNRLTEIKSLPEKLKTFYCGDNKLACLPKLPKYLNILSCYNNQLTKLPALPDELKVLDCVNNKLMYLPELPDTVTWLTCSDNVYLHINKRVAEKYKLEETPDYGKVALLLKQLVRAKKRLNRLIFCRELKDKIDEYIYLPGRVGYEELREVNKGRFEDL